MESKSPNIHFREIDAETVIDVCRLSDTLKDHQKRHVASNAVSIAQAHFDNDAWFRAIYADDALVGFIMLDFGSDDDKDVDRPAAFLWRFMIGGEFQGKNYGKLAMERLFEQLRQQGYSELKTSCSTDDNGPLNFYKGLGFVEDGEWYDDEIGLSRKLQ
ncbi:MAG TPA: N-acetyltransferase [Kosmotogaceae bacterium]|nr:MAG: Acetyltransferase [Thermotogales bacterium 46_20]HAA85521.1 N-acetyltransferase [Kosmotogaceae bacterium]